MRAINELKLLVAVACYRTSVNCCFVLPKIHTYFIADIVQSL